MGLEDYDGLWRKFLKGRRCVVLTFPSDSIFSLWGLSVRVYFTRYYACIHSSQIDVGLFNSLI